MKPLFMDQDPSPCPLFQFFIISPLLPKTLSTTDSLLGAADGGRSPDRRSQQQRSLAQGLLPKAVPFQSFLRWPVYMMVVNNRF